MPIKNLGECILAVAKDSGRKKLVQISIKNIHELNNEIGLGEYGVISAHRYKIALEYIKEECQESKRICEIGPGGVIAYISKFSMANTNAIVSPRENHWNEIFKNLI